MTAIDPQIFDELKKALTSFGDKYLVDDVLNRSKITDDLREYDEALLSKLFKISFIKDNYVKQVAGMKIFQIDQLEAAILYDDYWDTSYTKYENRIGLTTNGKFIEDNQDVVLNFPFKDGVLSASMTQEDKDAAYDDAFLNETIEKDEIDCLFDRKVLQNVKRYSCGAKPVSADLWANTDNLIIKGNNLLVLHTLQERYANKVKLIYLDPPYNTGKDFDYNDKFNESAWLTFMKNRLDAAKELLAEDGSIWVTLDNNEVYYLKPLMDELFGRENFVTDIIWVNNRQSKGYLDQISLHHNTILVYRKSEQFSLNALSRTEEDNKNYNNPDNDPHGAWRPSDVRNSLWRPNLQYDITTPSGNIIRHPENGWRFSKDTFERELAAGKIKFSEDETRVIRKIYLADQKGRAVESVWQTDTAGTTREANSEIKALFSETSFATPKPEKLLRRIIEIGSNEQDLVLDFFMGSATTQAVAMKMHRRFIGVEQMDYINTVSVPRLQGLEFLVLIVINTGDARPFSSNKKTPGLPGAML
jgi:adenine-specific DNA-methyltransferase